MNLLAETIEELKPHAPKDVLWVGTRGGVWFTWQEFASLADVEYDNGFGSQKVAQDLIIVGEGWWMSRTEYSGSEWWVRYELAISAIKPERHAVPRALTVGQARANGVKCPCGWVDLQVLNPEWLEI